MIVFLKKICDMESVQFDNGSLKIIARAADGSVRDGLSILDQSITFSDNSRECISGAFESELDPVTSKSRSKPKSK